MDIHYNTGTGGRRLHSHALGLIQIHHFWGLGKGSFLPKANGLKRQRGGSARAKGGAIVAFALMPW